MNSIIIGMRKCAKKKFEHFKKRFTGAYSLVILVEYLIYN
jgi:hypothetical protein